MAEYTSLEEIRLNKIEELRAEGVETYPTRAKRTHTSVEAIKAFELTLQLYPDNPEALNNLAWLLLTVEKRTLLDPIRALELAKKAVEIQARSHILDTLAEAYWQNGMADMAIETEQRALEDSSGNREYYRKQLKKFSLRTKS